MNREGKNAGIRYAVLEGIVPDPELLDRLVDLGDKATDPLAMEALNAHLDSCAARINKSCASQISSKNCRYREGGPIVGTRSCQSRTGRLQCVPKVGLCSMSEAISSRPVRSAKRQVF